MFEVGFTEIILILGIALLVLGPEKLPGLASQAGRWAGRARAMARQLRQQLDEEVTVVPKPDLDLEMAGLDDVEAAPLLDARGKPITATRGWYDSESLALDGSIAYVGVERVNQVLRYDFAKGFTRARGEVVPLPAAARKLPINKGLEALVFVPKGLPLGSPDEVRDLNQVVETIEVNEIRKALRIAENNKTRAADLLRISRFALQRKLEKYGIELPDAPE